MLSQFELNDQFVIIVGKSRISQDRFTMTCAGITSTFDVKHATPAYFLFQTLILQGSRIMHVNMYACV